MRTLILALTGLLASFLNPFSAGAAEPGNMKTSLVIDTATPGDDSRWGKYELYEFPADSVAPHTGNRKVLFGNPLEFNFSGLPDGEDCLIKATFLSDGARTMALDTNGTEIDSDISLEKGSPVELSWEVPGSRIYSGQLSLTFIALAGPNAVLQRLEILTRDGRKLTPGVRPEKKAATPEELDKLVMPFPRIAPRPTSVSGVKKPVISLNGTWKFSPDGKQPGKPIQVPGEWKMQGFDVPKGTFAVYTRSLDVPSDWKGKTAKLRFDAVHSVCEVYVNGESAGGHEGGFVPFELDVSGLLKPGKSNEILVRVQSESIADQMSCISQYASHQVGGIIRKATLYALPPTYVASESTWTTFNEDYSRPTLHYEADLYTGKGDFTKATVTLNIKDPSGKTLASPSSETSLIPGKFSKVSFELPMENPSLWTSETPSLYTIEVRVSSNQSGESSHSLKTGLRQVEVKSNQLFVNGKPVKLFGVNRHEVHPLRGRSLTPALCRMDAELYRSANVNLVRTSHYPPSEEFLDACDELGLFVESEAALCWVNHGANPIWRRWDYQDVKFFPYILRANLDHIAAYRNHPSLIFWSMGNESVWSPLWEKTLEVLKQVEKNRPFAFHDQAFGGYNNAGSKADIANYHYPSENNPDSWSSMSRPLWFGEYAHLQCYNRRELATDPGVREDWGRPLQRMVDLIWEQPGCLGGTIWSGIDDVFHLPDGNLCGYGHWGPIDAWRRVKPEYHGMKMSYTPFRVFQAETEPGKEVRLHVQNRQNFLDLKDCSITWSSGDKSGKLDWSLAPHAKSTFTVPGTFREGDVLTLTVTDPRGCLIGKEVFRISSPDKPGESPAPSGSLKLNSETAGFTLGESLSIPLPVPMALAHNNEGGAVSPGGTQLANVIEPFTPVEDWIWKKASGDNDSTTFTGTGAIGEGRLEVTSLPGNSFLVKYRVVLSRDIDPRQCGLVFSLPSEFSHSVWDRNAHWSWYPANDIGRASGKASANPVNREFVEEPGVEPENPWKDDSNTLGTNDFRSTKSGITRYTLADGKGNAFTVRPSGAPQAARSWIDGNKVRLLIAGFNTGGSDHFFRTHYQGEFKLLKKGEVIESSFIIQPGK